MDRHAMVVKSADTGGEVLNILGTQLQAICSGDSTGNKWSLMKATLPKESGPPSHKHPWDEAYYVLAGEVRFVLGDEVQVLSAGDFLYAPGGVAHAFQGISQTPAQMLIFDAPAHSQAFFREVDREVRTLPQDLAKMPAIGDRHQVQFLRQQ